MKRTIFIKSRNMNYNVDDIVIYAQEEHKKFELKPVYISFKNSYECRYRVSGKLVDIISFTHNLNFMFSQNFRVKIKAF